MNGREKTRFNQLHSRLLDLERMALMNEEEGIEVGQPLGATCCRGQAIGLRYAIEGLDKFIPKGEGDGGLDDLGDSPR